MSIFPRRHLLSLLLVAVVPELASAQPAANSAVTQTQLIGIWKVQHCLAEGGKKLVPEEIGYDWQLTLKKDGQFSITMGKDTGHHVVGGQWKLTAENVLTTTESETKEDIFAHRVTSLKDGLLSLDGGADFLTFVLQKQKTDTQEIKIPSSVIEFAHFSPEGNGGTIVTAISEARTKTEQVNGESLTSTYQVKILHAHDSQKIEAWRLSASGELEEKGDPTQKMAGVLVASRNAMTPYLQKLLKTGALVLVEKQPGASRKPGSQQPGSDSSLPGPAEVLFAVLGGGPVITYAVPRVEQRTATNAEGVQTTYTATVNEMRQMNSTVQCYAFDSAGVLSQCNFPQTTTPALFVRDKSAIDFLMNIIRPGAILFTETDANGPR